MSSILDADCAALLTETFPDGLPSSVEEARRRLERLRYRPIRIVSTPPPPGVSLPTGLWIADSRREDVVWVNHTLSPLHKLVIIAHEFGHMIWNHSPTMVLAHTGASANGVSRRTLTTLAGISEDRPIGLLGRCGGRLPVDDEQARVRELQAETLGRRLAAPFISDHHDRIASLLIGH